MKYEGTPPALPLIVNEQIRSLILIERESRKVSLKESYKQRLIIILLQISLLVQELFLNLVQCGIDHLYLQILSVSKNADRKRRARAKCLSRQQQSLVRQRD